MKFCIKYSFLFSFLIFFSCNKDDESVLPEETKTVYNYLFLGHIYERPNAIDQRIETADLSGYTQIWLGGDICSETTSEEATLEYLDDLFDLGSDSTHWALGNHDIRNGNLEWITSRTRRETYYVHTFDDITLLVLNNNYGGAEDCDLMEAQTDLIRTVCDTISASSHLVILMHKVVWGGINGVSSPMGYGNVDASWIPFECNPSERFSAAVYPELIKVQERGVSVMCIAGDLGQQAATFEGVTDDGIILIGSGITSEIPWHEQWPTHGRRDTVLVLTHDLAAKELNWEFIDIDDI